MRFTWQRDGLVILTVLTVLVLAPAGRGDDKKKADGDGAEKKPPVRAQEPDQEKKPTEIERFMELQLRQELLQERMRSARVQAGAERCRLGCVVRIRVRLRGVRSQLVAAV